MHFLWYKNLNFCEKKSGDEAKVVRCPFKANCLKKLQNAIKTLVGQVVCELLIKTLFCVV